MFKKLFFWGLTAGILSAVVSLIYNRIFQFSYTMDGVPDYSRLINIPVLIAVNIGVCMMAAIACWGFIVLFKKKAELAFNLLFAIISFGSIAYPISVTLPLDIQMPEFFPLLAIPLHFFPIIAWLILRPLFAKGVYE